MKRRTGTISRGIAKTLSGLRYVLRMSTWTMLTLLRRPIQMVLAFLTFCGWIGGVIVWPLLIYYGQQQGKMGGGWEAYAFFMGTGAVMGTVCPLLIVHYDSLLFRLQPRDRIIVYH